jgi:hypothetical protein
MPLLLTIVSRPARSREIGLRPQPDQLAYTLRGEAQAMLIIGIEL